MDTQKILIPTLAAAALAGTLGTAPVPALASTEVDGGTATVSVEPEGTVADQSAAPEESVAEESAVSVDEAAPVTDDGEPAAKEAVVDGDSVADAQEDTAEAAVDPQVEAEDATDAAAVASQADGVEAAADTPAEAAADTSAEPAVEAAADTPAEAAQAPVVTAPAPAVPQTVTAAAQAAGPLQVTGGVEGTDWTYDAEDHVLQILTDTPMTVANADPSTPADVAIAAHDTSVDLTLAGVNLAPSGSYNPVGFHDCHSVAFHLAPGTENRFHGGIGSAMVFHDCDSVTIDGAGALDLSTEGAKVAVDGDNLVGDSTLVIKGGIISISSPHQGVEFDDVTIDGGHLTVTAPQGAIVTRDPLKLNGGTTVLTGANPLLPGSMVVTGGSLATPDADPSTAATPVVAKAPDGTLLHPVRLSFGAENANSLVKSLHDGYGLHDVVTDGAGDVFIYLPAGPYDEKVSVQRPDGAVEEYDARGTVEADAQNPERTPWTTIVVSRPQDGTDDSVVAGTTIPPKGDQGQSGENAGTQGTPSASSSSTQGSGTAHGQGRVTTASSTGRPRGSRGTTPDTSDPAAMGAMAGLLGSSGLLASLGAFFRRRRS